jgi:hypothetical protein
VGDRRDRGADGGVCRARLGGGAGAVAGSQAGRVILGFGARLVVFVPFVFVISVVFVIFVVAVLLSGDAAPGEPEPARPPGPRPGAPTSPD